jgi:hypothetical protein
MTAFHVLRKITDITASSSAARQEHYFVFAPTAGEAISRLESAYPKTAKDAYSQDIQYTVNEATTVHGELGAEPTIYRL